ncbi:serine/threonine-protein phosphatase 7 long form homolog [Manihot esculenta]|uniref:serine/threonine-protein phosphatase 7 long form homolog n=1 Tax=Manihot esculenta TaxID=3983 RepID=UPI001CC556FC|nr:serine/threonine-protein phosphatase 7 long form homolog [Manihot esculenta]
MGLISGLPTDGNAVTGTTGQPWQLQCQDLLGLVPDREVMKGNTVALTWLRDNFDQIPEYADDVTIQRHARAFLLRLIGGSLFVDRSAHRVNLMFLPLLADFNTCGQYSWGAACLAWLYKELCRATSSQVQQVGGPLHILQIWAWDRIKTIAPTISQIHPLPDTPIGSRWSNARSITEVTTHVLVQLRYQLDRMEAEEFIWEPYSDDVVDAMPDYCLQGRQIWRSVVPLICFHIVEWHQPDRVLRQFGFSQPIPQPPRQTDDMHSIKLTSSATNWMTENQHWITLWESRHRRIVASNTMTQPLHYHSQYMEWYRMIARRWVSQKGASIGAVEDGLENCRLWASQVRHPTVDKIGNAVNSMFHALRLFDRISQVPPPQPAPPSQPLPDDVHDAPSSSRNAPRQRRHTTRPSREMEIPQPTPNQGVMQIPSPVAFHPYGSYTELGQSSQMPTYGDDFHSQYTGWTPGPSSMPFQSFTPTPSNYDQTGGEGMASTSFDFFSPAQPHTPSESVFPAFPRQSLDDPSSRLSLFSSEFPELFSATPYSGDFVFATQDPVVGESSRHRSQPPDLNISMADDDVGNSQETQQEPSFDGRRYNTRRPHERRPRHCGTGGHLHSHH